MKELSIEQKAMRYDEAIKKFKPIYDLAKNQGRTIDVEEFGNVFPELKESEEGKIKKIIKQSLKSFFEGKLSSGTNDVDYAMCLTWLKKQGKNNMGISEATKKKLEDNLNEALEKETPESWNKFLDEQGEQKPAEWSEEDEKMLNDAIGAIGAADYYTYDDKQEIENWLKSLKDRVGCEVNCITTKEWSDEDKQYLLVCKNALYKYQSSDQWDASIIIRWLENKLKSFRPQNYWKPSDEQLNNILDVLSFDNCTHKRRELLESLYNDLKKLKG